MGILSVGMQFAADKEMGARIASHTFRLGQQLLETVDSSEEPFRALDINAIQAYLLLELHAALYSGSWATSVGMKMHHRSVEVSLCRIVVIMAILNILACEAMRLDRAAGNTIWEHWGPGSSMDTVHSPRKP